jgi:hypothetical protein
LHTDRQNTLYDFLFILFAWAFLLKEPMAIGLNNAARFHAATKRHFKIWKSSAATKTPTSDA